MHVERNAALLVGRTADSTGYIVTSNYVSLGTIVYEETSMAFTFVDGAAPTRYTVTGCGRFKRCSSGMTRRPRVPRSCHSCQSCAAHTELRAYGFCPRLGTCVEVTR